MKRKLKKLLSNSDILIIISLYIVFSVSIMIMTIGGYFGQMKRQKINNAIERRDSIRFYNYLNKKYGRWVRMLN